MPPEFISCMKTVRGSFEPRILLTASSVALIETSGLLHLKSCMVYAPVVSRDVQIYCLIAGKAFDELGSIFDHAVMGTYIVLNSGIIYNG
jgi:hypothetical protein